MSRYRKIRRRNVDWRGFGSAWATKQLDACLIDAFDHNAADDGAGDGGVAEPLAHDGLDVRGRRIESGITDLIAREDRPDLFAVAAPGCVVQNNALATAGLGESRSKRHAQG